MAVNLLRPACGPLLLAFAAGLCAWSVDDARAATGTPPPRWERAAELVAPTVFRLEQLRDAGTPGLPDSRTLGRCAERAAAAVGACARGRRPAPFGCATRLAAAAIALDAAADPATPAGAWTAFVALDAARLALLLRVLDRARDECVDPPRDAGVAAVIGWRAGGRALEVEPARPLAPGTRYRLRVAPPIPVASTDPRLDGRGRLMAAPAPGATLPAVAAYLRRMRRDAALVAGLTTRPSLTLRLPRPLPLAEAAALTAVFEPLAAEDAWAGVAVTTAAPARLGDHPAAGPRHAPPRPIAADEREALGLGGPMLANADLRLGTFSSHDPTTGAARDVPYLVAAPATRTPADGVVLLLDGLGGSAGPFLRIRGASLLAEGLTLVAMDLPAHGMRSDGEPFLDAHDPAVLRSRLETAVADVLALAAHLRTAAALAPDVPPPATIRVLGYSIGAAVASVALALDPALGAAVLIAPPGDLADFLAVSTSAAFGEPILRCLAGGRIGAPCGDEEACADGACVFNPTLLPLVDTRTAVRTLLASIDPQTYARGLAGPGGARPILLQIGGRDGVVAPEGTLWLAAALEADLTCARRADRPQTLCRFAEAGHDVVWHGEARRQADAFLASDGAVLTPSGDAWAAR